MRDLVVRLPPAAASPPVREPGYSRSSPAQALVAILSLLEKSGVPYVVLHGYEKFPEISGSDVDICLDRSISDRSVQKLLDDNAEIIGARVVSFRSGAILMVGWTTPHQPFFLKLDLERDYALNGMAFISGSEVLAARRHYENFHVPSPAHQLAGQLATSIIKGRLDAARTDRLSELYSTDPAGAMRETARLWSKAEHEIVAHALANNVWEYVIEAAPRLRTALIGRLSGKTLHARTIQALGLAADRVRRIVSPPGISVALLGPDGAGKSTLIEAVESAHRLPVFDRSICWGFAPPLHRLVRRNVGASSQPHALPPRSQFGSLIKAAYWLVYSISSYLRAYIMKARGGLVLYDRHFSDVLVDPVRYRYNGPGWILKAIWFVIPKPDLIVLLDAPAETIYKRKQELSVEEIRRLLLAYRELVRGLPNGVILDGNKPQLEVIETFNCLLLKRAIKASENELGSRDWPRPYNDKRADARAITHKI